MFPCSHMFHDVCVCVCVCVCVSVCVCVCVSPPARIKSLEEQLVTVSGMSAQVDELQAVEAALRLELTARLDDRERDKREFEDAMERLRAEKKDVVDKHGALMEHVRGGGREGGVAGRKGRVLGIGTAQSTRVALCMRWLPLACRRR